MTNAIDKKIVAQSFSRAADHYDDVAHLQREVGAELLALLPGNRHYRRALDIGCGTGQLTRHLCEYAAHVTALDMAPGMLDFARIHHGDVIADFICADADALPFAPASFDLVFSNFALQWCASLPGLLQRLHTQLQAGGILAFSIPGENTLWELKQSWQHADPSHVHVNPFLTLKEVEAAIVAAGFEILHLGQDRRTLYYANARALTSELKTLGAHNANNGRSTHLTGKQRVAAFITAYETLRTAEGLPASWNIISVIVRKPVLDRSS